MVKVEIFYFIQILPLLQKLVLDSKVVHMRTNIPNRVRLLVARTANASGAVSTTVKDRYISV